MDIEKIKKEIEDLSAAMTKIEMQAESEGRPLSREEESLRAEMTGTINALKLELPANSPLTLRNWNGGGGGGYSDIKVFKSIGEQLMAVKEAGLPAGRVDPRLYQIRAATGLSESVPSEGGFLLQPTFSTDILQVAFDTGKVAKLCGRQPIGANSNSIKINGLDETSRITGSRHGGVQSYWIGEAEEKTKSKPKFRQIELILKKNIVLVYATDELLEDAIALEAFVRRVASTEISFNVDDAIINGTGAGQPLGILASGCLVSVAKEVGQKASTLVIENVVKMYSRLLPGSEDRAVWLINRNVLPQLFTMSLSVGTGGIPVYMPANALAGRPYQTLFGLPVIKCEQCATLGTLGDIILGDFGEGYILADKGGVKSDVSIHVLFVHDESVFRFVLRIDGQPVLASAITPYKGSDALSYFVALASRV